MQHLTVPLTAAGSTGWLVISHHAHLVHVISYWFPDSPSCDAAAAIFQWALSDGWANADPSDHEQIHAAFAQAAAVDADATKNGNHFHWVKKDGASPQRDLAGMFIGFLRKKLIRRADAIQVLGI